MTAREPESKNPDHPTDEAVAQEAGVVAPLPRGPIDGDWPAAGKGAAERSGDEDAEDADVYGDPDKVKDESPLESLGEAVSEPLRDAASGPAGDVTKKPG